MREKDGKRAGITRTWQDKRGQVNTEIMETMIIDLIGNKPSGLRALSSAEASLYSGTMPWLIPYQVNNHSLHDFRIGIPSGSLCGGESTKRSRNQCFLYKQWFGILLMPKIDKNYLTPEFWEETHSWEILILWHFDFSTKYDLYWPPCWRAYCRPPTWQPKLLLCLYLVKRNDSYAQMCCKRYYVIFSTLSLKFKCKICVQKAVIHNFKKHILVTWPATNLLILRKWCGFERPNKKKNLCIRT